MRSITTETCRPLPEPAQTLAMLDAAMRRQPLEAATRVVATDDSRSVEEGLAVLRCYVAIADREVRQALLDVLVRVAENTSD